MPITGLFLEVKMDLLHKNIKGRGRVTETSDEAEEV